MQFTRTAADEILHVTLEGRIDGYWADHLDAALAEAVAEGHHCIAVDCAQVSFLSSAGIGILMKHYKELKAISGIFQVVNPSQTVATVLRVTNLTDLLVARARPAAPPAAPTRHARQLESDSLRLDVFDLDPHATLTCRVLGTPEPLPTGRFPDGQSISLGGTSPAFVVGVGAFGASFADCRARFGELISVAGATAYQPADGTNVPDYLLARGALAADVRLLYGLAFEGSSSHLVRFESDHIGGVVALTTLADVCLRQAGADAIGIVLLAETAGLVGAELRRSPAESLDPDGDFFAFPSVRRRLTFTGEPAYPRSVSLSAGIVSRRTDGAWAAQLRPIGGGLNGHIHAAAFNFHPIQKGYVELQPTVERLFEPDQLAGVLHLLNDDRGTLGAGQSEFFRGACWVAPVAAAAPSGASR
jgi:anti-anti-sigma factor